MDYSGNVMLCRLSEGVDVDRAIRSILIRLVWGGAVGNKLVNRELAGQRAVDRTHHGAPNITRVQLGGCTRYRNSSYTDSIQIATNNNNKGFCCWKNLTQYWFEITSIIAD